MGEDDLTGSAGLAAVVPAVSRETADGSRADGDVPVGQARGPRQAAPAVPAGPAGRGTAAGVPRSAARARPARTSKCDALRDLLAGKGAGPVTLTLAEIGLLAGTLPRPARLYQLWWRNDDPTHPRCRSWGDAGYTAHPRKYHPTAAGPGSRIPCRAAGSRRDGHDRADGSRQAAAFTAPLGVR